MSKQYTNIIPALVCSVLIGCASGTGGDSGTETAAPPADVDSSTLAAYKKAVNTMKNGRDDAATGALQCGWTDMDEGPGGRSGNRARSSPIQIQRMLVRERPGRSRPVQQDHPASGRWRREAGDDDLGELRL